MNKRCLLFVALVMLVQLSGEAWLVAAPAPQPAVAQAETTPPDVDTAHQRDRELPARLAGRAEYEGNPVMGGQHGTCFDISVLKEGELYRMWLSWRPKASVALVESRDGFHWSEPPRIVLGPRKETGWEDDLNRPVVLKREERQHLLHTGH